MSATVEPESERLRHWAQPRNSWMTRTRFSPRVGRSMLSKELRQRSQIGERPRVAMIMDAVHDPDHYVTVAAKTLA
jgi:hypothetical protein